MDGKGNSLTRKAQLQFRSSLGIAKLGNRVLGRFCAAAGWASLWGDVSTLPGLGWIGRACLETVTPSPSCKEASAK